MSTIANLKINVIANTRSLTKGLKNARGKVITFRSAIKSLAKGLVGLGFATAAIGAYAFAKGLLPLLTVKVPTTLAIKCVLLCVSVPTLPVALKPTTGSVGLGLIVPIAPEADTLETSFGIV